jgi:serine/threonine protein kinase
MEPSRKIVSPYLRELRISDILIDAGGRAMPYKAYDAEEKRFFLKAFNKPRIIKDLLDDIKIKEQAELCIAFERKQEALYMASSRAQADCDELVQFFDFFPYRGVYYAVYDFVGHVDAEELDREGLDTKVLVLADAAAGLARLHAFGILHGDVKPANLLLYRGADDRTGKEGHKAARAKLIDYDGGCLMAAPPPLRYRLLDFDEVYASPEFLRFLKHAPDVQLASSMDVFSLAMTAARVLLGQLPMNAVEALINGVQPKDLLQLETLPQPAVGDLITRGLSLDPEKRPTAIEFRETLSQSVGRNATWTRSMTKSLLNVITGLRKQRTQPQDEVVAAPSVPLRRSGQHGVGPEGSTTYPGQRPPDAGARPPAARSPRAPRLEGIQLPQPPVKPGHSLTDD